MLSKLLETHIEADISKLRAPDFLAKQIEFETNKLNNVNNGHGWRDVTSCPVCDSKEFEEELVIYDIPLVKCLECEARYHSRMAKDPNDIYQASDYSVYTVDDFEINYQYRIKRFGEERVRLLQTHCGDLSDKSLLDVGCGDGYFLTAAKKHLRHCVGSEFSRHLAEFTQERTGLNVYQNTLDEIPERDFDVVTSFDVIEHIQQPLPFMQDIHKILNKDGHLLLYTPNFDSFSIKVMRNDSSLIDGTEHVVLFNHRSLEKIGELSGFKVIHTETRGLDIHSILSYQHHHQTNESNEFLKQWNNELQAMIDGSQAADYIRVIYQKI